MSKFEVGDKAEVINGIDDKHRSYIGAIVTIETELTWSRFNPTGEWFDIYGVDLAPLLNKDNSGLSIDIAFRPCDLKPINDGEEASWEQVEKITAWRPKELVHVETNS